MWAPHSIFGKERRLKARMETRSIRTVPHGWHWQVGKTNLLQIVTSLGIKWLIIRVLLQTTLRGRRLGRLRHCGVFFVRCIRGSTRLLAPFDNVLNRLCRLGTGRVFRNVKPLSIRVVLFEKVDLFAFTAIHNLLANVCLVGFPSVQVPADISFDHGAERNVALMTIHGGSATHENILGSHGWDVDDLGRGTFAFARFAGRSQSFSRSCGIERWLEGAFAPRSSRRHEEDDNKISMRCFIAAKEPVDWSLRHGKQHDYGVEVCFAWGDATPFSLNLHHHHSQVPVLFFVGSRGLPENDICVEIK